MPMLPSLFWVSQIMKKTANGNNKLTLMPLWPTLCACENVDLFRFWFWAKCVGGVPQYLSPTSNYENYLSTITP